MNQYFYKTIYSYGMEVLQIVPEDTAYTGRVRLYSGHKNGDYILRSPDMCEDYSDEPLTLELARELADVFNRIVAELETRS